MRESDVILAWSKDIEKYVADTLPDFHFTQQQLKAAKAFVDLCWSKIEVNGNPNGAHSDQLRELSRKFGMSIMSGVGTGKGALASLLVMWFLSVFPFPKCVAVSPSARQLRDNLWSELAKWHQKSKLRDWFQWQSDKFFLKEHEGQQWFISARTANPRNSADEQAETLAGIHEDFVLIVGDEDRGVHAGAPTVSGTGCSGSQSRAVVPWPGSLVNVMSPPCASAIFRQIARPRPVPCCFPVVKNG